MDEKRGTPERVARTIITMLAGMGLLYVSEIFQIARRIDAANGQGYDVASYDPPITKAHR